jgi:limonene-1,2-epoxide hydrolase
VLDDTATKDPQAIAEGFLEAMASSEVDRALAFLAEDVEYVNVGFPPIRGRRGVRRVLGGLERPGSGFEVYLHSIAAEGPTVLTERTDVIVVGRFRSQFWVWGRFDVHDGKITLWRDSFDFLDIARSVVRGLAGIVFPGLRPAAPSSPDAAPGR